MKPLFENRYKRDKDMVKELYQYLFFKRPLNLAVNILFLTTFLLELAACIWAKDSNIIFWIIALSFISVYEGVMYRRSVNNTVKRDLEVNQGMPLEITLTVNEEGIMQKTSAGGESKLLYADIKKVMQTKRLIMIQTNAKMLYLLRKDCFTVGTADGFMKFLQENRG